MKILFVGRLPWHRPSSTNLHRFYAMKKIVTNIDYVDMSLKMGWYEKLIYHLSNLGIKINIPDPSHNNERIINAVKEREYDLLWIDKGFNILPSTLKAIKSLQPNCKIVHYMIDDFMNPYHATKQILDTIPLYDYYIVNRFVNIAELQERGCKKPIHVFMSYEKTFHYPRVISDKERCELGGDVGFIGTYERERADSICYLVDNGIKVRVWGNGWNKLCNYSENLKIEGKGLYDEDFCKAIGSFKINLGFLRKKSRDNHTTRSSEIPACGGFFLAERTAEHESMYLDGQEAVFFDSNEDLLGKCRYYLNHEKERKCIAESGRSRCMISDYSNEGMIRRVLKTIMEDND